MALNDDIKERLAEIEQAVKNNQTVDWDKVRADFEKSHKEYIDSQIQEKLDSRPMRRVPGALIGPDGTKIGKDNRYFRHLHAFEKDGYYRVGTVKVQPVDLWLAHTFMSKAAAIAAMTKLTGVKGPSDDLTNAVKALTSTGTGLGDEFVPTDLADTVWMDFFIPSRVAASITTVPMPSDPFDIPLGLGAVVWRKGTQNQATTHSDPTTAKSTLTTTELVTEQRWSYTLDEDSIIAIMPLLRQELGRSGAEIIDDFAINADNTDAATGNINSDDANPPDDSYYLSDGQDGLRHLWIVDNTNQTVNAAAAALTDAHIISALGKMGKYGVDPTSNAIICDVNTYLGGFLNLTNVLTVDKFGPNAVVLTGQLAAYRGIPVIPSAVHRLAAADGKLDAATPSNNTLGSLTIYNRMMWYLGFRRQLLIEVDRDIQTRQFIMVSSFRVAIGTRGTRSSSTVNAGVRNILV
jgi:HK97 family phage major capsid protein